jgi:phosphate transport system substrate-binding protein
MLVRGLLLLALLQLPASVARAETTISGSGATFPAPLYAAWIERYHEVTETRIRYSAVGSGEGVRQLIAGEVELGASDTQVPEKMRPADEQLVHIPTCIGAVVLTYNLPDVPDIRLTPELIAAVFSGEITRWDDTELLRANAGVGLPDTPITVVHRHDASGTTDLFSRYLSASSRRWKRTIGSGTTLDWPVGYGADGNDGVARMVSRSRGAIGYVELTFAVREGLPLARVQNRSGAFVRPSVQSASAAATGPPNEGCATSLLEARDRAAYPIAAFTWIVVPQELNRPGLDCSESRAIALARFLWWAIHDGQQMNEQLLYGSLPEHARECARSSLRQLTWNGESLLP